MSKVSWRRIVPSCAPDECFDANNLGDAVFYAMIELDLIDEGREAAVHYTKSEVKKLRKFVTTNVRVFLEVSNPLGITFQE